MERRLLGATETLWAEADGLDCDGADPAALCEPLRQTGLFIDVLPREHGGAGLSTAPSRFGLLARVLGALGGANLSAGRIFEGHVNAVKLVWRYGDDHQRAALTADIRAGAVCGVWNAEAPPGLRIDAMPAKAGPPARLQGGKIYASGLGLVTRPLITARTPNGDGLMIIPSAIADRQFDLAEWRVRGMKATATGSIDFSGLAVTASEVVGGPGDYYRSPLFKGGAWRFAAVQTGAIQRLSTLLRSELNARRRADDPHQKARIAHAALAAETARLWVLHAAELAESENTEPAAADAYVNLARLAVERAGLEVIALAERGLGLAAFTRPNPVDRVVRDLSTYLRQPFPDGALEDASAYLTQRGDAALDWERP